MTSPAIKTTSPPEAAHWKGLLLVFTCTLFGAIAQLLIKRGMNQFKSELMALVTNVPLVVGYSFYGLNAAMMVLALKNGEMSRLYPIIGLTYVWTTLLCYTVLGEPSNLYKNVGIVVIVIGVAVMGLGGRK